MLRLLFVFALCLIVNTPRCVALDAELSEPQKKQLASLITQFERASKSLSRRKLVAIKVLRLGRPATEQLIKVIDEELDPQLKLYEEQVLQAAQATISRKRGSVGPEEITALQRRVLDLQKDPNLTEQTIVQIADPIMARLHDLMVVDRELVLTSNPKLLETRQQLDGLGSIWEKCITQINEASSLVRFQERLVNLENSAVLLALPISEKARTVLETNSQLVGKFAAEESACMYAANLTRILLGLEPLLIDPTLVQVARDHSEDMEKLNFFSHDSPVPGKTTFVDRAKRLGASASGENIALGVSDGYGANKMWFHSPPHHRNLLGKHTRIGVGRSGRLWTEMFGR